MTTKPTGSPTTSVGSFQDELGCPGDWQPDCLRSWLQDPDGDGIYIFSTSELPVGNYEVKVAHDEAWDESYPGSNVPFTVPASCTEILFTYNPVTHLLDIATAPGGPPCSDIETANIEVIKDLVPADDSGLFNLQIDSTDAVTDVGNGGTTGSVTVGAGSSDTPGATHTVGETAGTSTGMASYNMSISCVDRGLATFDGGPSLTQAGAGPLTVPVDPDDDIVCTITNTNGCETTVCEDSACAVLVCDPSGAVGNCDAVTYTPGVVCRPGSDDVCDPDEICVDGQATCPADFITPPGAACGDDSATACTEPDTCDGAGICEFNNMPCGFATDSSLCEYDMEPAKGDCSTDGSTCVFDLACAGIGGATCTSGGDCQDASGSYLGACVPDSVCADNCEQSDQFRLLFSPDVKNWAAYKLNASNPGQTYYNLIYDASAVGTDDVTLTVTIPYPYVTVGGNPLHVYDADMVETSETGCLDPSGADNVDYTASGPLSITLDDWLNGVAGAGDYSLFCDQVPGPGGAGSCTFEVMVLNGDIPPGGLIYLNVHLDYGLKGQFVDANPFGPDPVGLEEDRYDRHPYLSPWDSSDALVNTSTDDGPLALADCQSYWFEHTDGNTDPLFKDQLQNLNIFKKIAGAFGRVWCADGGNGLEYYLRLVHPSKGVVQITQADEDGYYALSYKHKGKPTVYTVEVDTVDSFVSVVATTTVELQGNSWAEVNFWADDCSTVPFWNSLVIYGSGRNKK